MRQVQPKQLRLGQVSIAEIKFNPRSRDDIPQVLKGLQHIYVHEPVREAIFLLLESLIPDNVDKTNGRPGMDLWIVLVMGVLRLNLNWDYDRLQEMVSQYRTIREMLGHGLHDESKEYSLQTLKDNASLLTPEVLNVINEIVVKAGHIALKKRNVKMPM